MLDSRTSLPFWGMLTLACLPCASYAAKATTQSLNEQYGGALTNSGDYLYGSNKWGDDGSGNQTMTVLLADTDGAAFNATWMWTNNSEYVHAYPNVGYESYQLPTQISNIKSFQMSGSWSVYPVGEEDSENVTTALNAIGCKCDIALDMFLDVDNVTSTNASAASHEVMVWQSIWGGVWPIGYYDPPTGAPEYNLSGVTYQLFTGFNQQYQKQAVFSWVPTVNLDSVDADVSELLQHLTTLGNITSDMYVGLIQWGSETVHATSEVQLEMKDIQMSLGVSSSKPSPTTTSASATATKKGAANALRPEITNLAVLPAAFGLAAALLI